MAKSNVLHERVARLEERDVSQKEKIDAIHKILVGNGQPGLVTEWNQWKGAIKLSGWIGGTTIGILSVAIGILAYIK